MNEQIDFEILIEGGTLEEYRVTGHEDEVEVYVEDENEKREDPFLSDDLIRSDEHFKTESIDHRPEDEAESNVVENFIETTCGCRINGNQPCSNLFSKGDFEIFLDDFLELTKEEKDLYVLTLLRSYTNTDDDKNTFEPKMKGKSVCMKTFFVLNGIGSKRFYDIKKYFIHSNTISPRTHQNSGRLPSNACKFEDVL